MAPTGKIIEEAGERACDVHDAREAARREAIKAVRAMERGLKTALAGENLRGLVNLGAGSGAVLYGARLRAYPDLPMRSLKNRSTAIIKPDGTLAEAAYLPVGEWSVADLPDVGLKAEDARSMAEVLSIILPRHIAACDRSEARYLALCELAEGIQKVLGVLP